MEIERRFLFKPEIDINTVVAHLSYKHIQQGYLCVDKEGFSCVRVRVVGEDAFLTIKKQVSACSAYEFEYPIPYTDALCMLDVMRQGYIIEKKRYYYINQQNMCFEIDIFMKENEGLSIIEVELPSEDFPLKFPSWVGEEITGKSQYTNAMLSSKPFSLWDSTIK